MFFGSCGEGSREIEAPWRWERPGGCSSPQGGEWRRRWAGCHRPDGCRWTGPQQTECRVLDQRNSLTHTHTHPKIHKYREMFSGRLWDDCTISLNQANLCQNVPASESWYSTLVWSLLLHDSVSYRLYWHDRQGQMGSKHIKIFKKEQKTKAILTKADLQNMESL